mgnify:CR=1 FL=1
MHVAHLPRVPRRANALAGLVLLVLGLWATPATAADKTELSLPANTVSLSVGLPLAVGGLASLEWLHRIDERNFVMVGGGTELLLNGVYLSFGQRFEPGPADGWLWFIGMDGNVFSFMGPPVYFPGAHIGVGGEWFWGTKRISLTANTGFPWVGGLRLSIGR